MILKRLLIENFRGIRGKLELEFDPDVNLYVLVGKNSSGKSSMLEVIKEVCWNTNPPSNIKVEFNPKIKAKPKAYYIRPTKGITDTYRKLEKFGKSDFERLIGTYNKDNLDRLSEVVSEFVSKNIGNIKEIKFEKVGNEIKISLDGQSIELEDLSSGFQAIITIEAVLNYPGAFRTLEEDGPVIFLIEEPETFLHPNLLRVYADKFIKFAMQKKNAELFISTHSPILLSFVEPHQVIRLEGGRAYYTKEKDFKGWHMISDPAKAEIFFADRVIMLEGYTDKLIFSALLKRARVNPEDNNVSLVYIDGVYNREAITKICEAFEIKNLFIGDKDQEKYEKRGGSREDLSFEVLLPYGEIEDCIPLVDWAMALKENFISFMLDFLTGKKKSKVWYALKLREFYLNNSINEKHPLYPIRRIMEDFIKIGELTKKEFPKKYSLNDEIRDKYYIFIEENIKGELEYTDLNTEENKSIGVFFREREYRKLNELLVELTKGNEENENVEFYVVAYNSYDLEAPKRLIEKHCEGVEFDTHENFLKIKKTGITSLICKTDRPLTKKDLKKLHDLEPLSKE